MSDSETDPLRDLLSQFALGPSWARSTDKPQRAPRTDAGKDDRPPRREGRDDRQQGGGRGRDDRDRRDNRGGGEGRRPFQGGGAGGGGNRNFQDRRNGPPQREDIAPAQGVRVTIVPDNQAVHLIGKEVHQVARVYPLFDVAQILLAERARCRALFEVEESRPPLYLGKLDESLFLTREEALHHLWQSEARKELMDEETIEVEPPKGNFQSVARCGISGEWLGPPNFHSYQTNLRRLHRERFSNMPFEAYSAKVRTERGEEAVNAWLETTKQKTRWKLKGGEDNPWIDERVDAERVLAFGAFDKAFAETRKAEISAAIPAKSLSPSLLASLRVAGSHARKHPAILIPAVCRALEAEHLPVFKRQGKLHTGPARPHALAPDAVLAERPGKMVAWIRENSPAKLAGLWQAVLPEGSTAPPAEYAADLFWLLQQGHILLYTDDTLVVQEVREPTPPQPKSEKKKKKKTKPKDPSAAAAQGESQEESTEEETEAEAIELPSAEELLNDTAALETPDTSDEEEAVLENASEEEPSVTENVQPESSEEVEPSEQTVSHADDTKLPDEDFAEPSEAPQKPE